MCIEMTAPGTTVSVLGDAVSRTIRAAGFRPIENLTGTAWSATASTRA